MRQNRKKPCSRCYGVHKPGDNCPKIFGEEEDGWRSELKTPGEEKSSDRKEKKKALDEVKENIKKLKLDELELNQLLFSVQERAEELGARMVHGDDGRLRIVPGLYGYHGYNNR